jgi:hypothetical protein
MSSPVSSLRLYLANQAFSDARKNDIWPVLLVFVLPLFVHLPDLLGWWSANPLHIVSVSWLPSLHGKQMLPGYPEIDPTTGTYAQALGKLAADEWLHAKIPWWNYYSGVGLPLAAEMSPAAFFLPFVLLNHFSQGWLYIEVVMQILAGLGTYYLLRKIGLIRLAAITGAILYEFCGVFTWLGTPISSTIPFLPWLILGIEHAREKSLGRSPGGWLIVAISLAFLVYAGFPESAYINGLLAAVWSLWRLCTTPSGIRYRFIRKLVTGVIVGLLLSVPVIIPFIEFCRYSYLGGHTFDTGYGGLRSEALPQMFFPWLYGGIWSYSDDSHILSTIWGTVGGYLSATQLAIIVLGSLVTQRRSLYAILLIWILVCLGRTFAVPFLSTLVDLVPLLKLVALFRYAPQSWEFCSAVLCAIVVHDISSGCSCSRRKLTVGLLIALSSAIISIYPARSLLEHLYFQNGFSLFFWGSLAWGIGTVVMGALLLTFFKGRHLLAGGAIATLLAVDAVALFSLPTLYAQSGGRSRSAGIHYLQKHLGTDRFYTLGPIAPNYGAYYRIGSINHNYMPIPTNWVTYIRNYIDPYSDPVCFTGNFKRINPEAPTQAEVLRANIEHYKQVGVRYVVSRHSENPFEQPTHDSATIPSGYAPKREQAEERPQRVFESSDMDIYELSGVRPYFDLAQGDGYLHIEDRSAVSVSCSSESQLIRRELYYPGWKAFVGGKSIDIEPYDDIFQTIRIPAGQYRITFAYTPTHIHLISALFLFGALWLVVGGIRSRNAVIAGDGSGD